MMTEIRAALIGDVKSIQILVTSLSHYYLSECTNNLPPWFNDTLTEASFLTRIQSTEFKNYVYMIENIIVGYISIKHNHHIYHLFVSEKYQRQGISKQLWNYAKTQCLSSYYTVRSSTFAIQVYKNFGFIEVGEIAQKDGISYLSMKLDSLSIYCTA